ncbi:unnamed protein product, partial [Amoebophrya sp. A120]
KEHQEAATVSSGASAPPVVPEITAEHQGGAASLSSHVKSSSGNYKIGRSASSAPRGHNQPRQVNASRSSTTPSNNAPRPARQHLVLEQNAIEQDGDVFYTGKEDFYADAVDHRHSPTPTALHLFEPTTGEEDAALGGA